MQSLRPVRRVAELLSLGHIERMNSVRRIYFISILILIGAFPLSAGAIFHSSWLRWTGIAFAGLAFVMTAFQLLLVGWFWIRSPRPRPMQRHTPIHEDDA